MVDAAGVVLLVSNSKSSSTDRPKGFWLLPLAAEATAGVSHGPAVFETGAAETLVAHGSLETENTHKFKYDLKPGQ